MKQFFVIYLGIVTYNFIGIVFSNVFIGQGFSIGSPDDLVLMSFIFLVPTYGTFITYKIIFEAFGKENLKLKELYILVIVFLVIFTLSMSLYKDGNILIPSYMLLNILVFALCLGYIKYKKNSMNLLGK